MSTTVERLALLDAGERSVMAPNESGRYVRFADVEDALKDAERFEWLRPVIEGNDDREADRRTVALGLGLVEGLTGRELVDWARARCAA